MSARLRLELHLAAAPLLHLHPCVVIPSSSGSGGVRISPMACVVPSTLAHGGASSGKSSRADPEGEGPVDDLLIERLFIRAVCGIAASCGCVWHLHQQVWEDEAPNTKETGEPKGSWTRFLMAGSAMASCPSPASRLSGCSAGRCLHKLFSSMTLSLSYRAWC
ncbi:unnamed protein product [Urochloa humidicola]